MGPLVSPHRCIAGAWVRGAHVFVGVSHWGIRLGQYFIFVGGDFQKTSLYVEPRRFLLGLFPPLRALLGEAVESVCDRRCRRALDRRCRVKSTRLPGFFAYDQLVIIPPSSNERSPTAPIRTWSRP